MSRNQWLLMNILGTNRCWLIYWDRMNSPFLTADRADNFVRWQTPVVRWQNLSSRPGYVRIHTVTSWSQHITLFLPIFRFLIRFFSRFRSFAFHVFSQKSKGEPKKLHGGYCPSATLNSEHPFVAVLLAHDGTHRPD